MELKPEYFYHEIDANFVVRKAFYFFYMPFPMSTYNKFKKELLAKGIVPDFKIGMLEKGKMFGVSWMAMADENNGTMRIKDKFIAYKIVGEYKQMMSAYKKIMKDYPEAKEFHNLYLTDPNVTPMSENITYIMFKV